MEEHPRSSKWRGGCGCLIGISVLVLVAYPIVVSLLPPPRPYMTQCLNNLKQMGLAIEMYTNDWRECYPSVSARQRVLDGRTWPDRLRPYVKNDKVFRCPKAEDRPTYAFNRRLSGRKLDKIGTKTDGTKYRTIEDAAETICVFETVNDSPANNNLNGDTVSHPTRGSLPKPGTLVAWPKPPGLLNYIGWPKWARPRHRARSTILWADGHVSTTDGKDMDKHFGPATH